MHKIIINLGVAAYEQSNVVGERFSADDSFSTTGKAKILLVNLLGWECAVGYLNT